ncbi:hypothetical protein [Pseudomonas mosselii]|uniref:hypothetical protein n=1 Tax=Pseudomonas mosselii TaxID=78327 RepID=UPI0021D96109|nr:hypothetical protein [Pseudomonas mosselii]MCU9527523.1 hypothetical protein [Pseudomonas mosselii]MCU9534836.1 hypothetical protein [Pseudomonas mosselii]MCU9542770.1 hypothetical protein [Pseudomonas mosselii]MCU9546676.1 hypothetical protein [Pseudomonas mosselii]
MKIVIVLRPLHVLALSAAILVAGYAWQQHWAQAEAQRQASIDAECAAQAVQPPAPLKRSLVCIGWSPKTDQLLPARG